MSSTWRYSRIEVLSGGTESRPSQARPSCTAMAFHEGRLTMRGLSARPSPYSPATNDCFMMPMRPRCVYGASAT